MALVSLCAARGGALLRSFFYVAAFFRDSVSQFSTRVDAPRRFAPAAPALRLPLVSFVAVAVAACATVSPSVPEGSFRDALWDAHRQQVAAIGPWRLAGRVAVSNATESWQANVYWWQSAERFDVKLIGPFGQGAVRITSGATGVQMELPDGQRVAGGDAATLLNQALGWEIPVAALSYWVRGLPASADAAEMVLDEAGRLARLDQMGWRVAYQRYDTVEGTALPAKLFAEDGAWKLRLVVDEWRLLGVSSDAAAGAP
jgi:outer membrane lipoprotein LolB